MVHGNTELLLPRDIPSVTRIKLSSCFILQSRASAIIRMMVLAVQLLLIDMGSAAQSIMPRVRRDFEDGARFLGDSRHLRLIEFVL